LVFKKQGLKKRDGFIQNIQVAFQVAVVFEIRVKREVFFFQRDVNLIQHPLNNNTSLSLSLLTISA